MAKKSLTAQFDEIQAQLEAHGLTVRRDSKLALRAWLSHKPYGAGFERALASIDISRQHDKPGIQGHVSVHHLTEWADPAESPRDVLASLMSKPFGHTTIGAVFGL